MEHLLKIQLPFRPVRAFVGEISVDLSFLFGGRLEVSVKDVLVVLEKENLDEAVHPQMILDSLQAWISLLYFTQEYPFSLSPHSDSADKDKSDRSPFLDPDSFQRLLERMVLNVENVHIRIEDYDAVNVHLSTMEEEVMALGIQFHRFSLRSPSASELQQTPEHFLSPTSKSALIVNKVLEVNAWCAYCSRTSALFPEEFGDISREFVRNSFVSATSPGLLIHPVNVKVTMAGAYLKGSFLIKPLKVHCTLSGNSLGSTPGTPTPIVPRASGKKSSEAFPEDGVRVRLSDDQLLYLGPFSEYLREYGRRLQDRVRTSLLHPAALSFPSYRPLVSDSDTVLHRLNNNNNNHTTSGSSNSNKTRGNSVRVNNNSAGQRERALLRWWLIRESIKVDFRRFAGRDRERGGGGGGGQRMKWRVWFETWVYVARYL